MSNELYQHKRSDTIKWVLTLLAFILVGVMLAGIILGWFEKKEESPAEEEQTEQAAVIDGEGNAMDADTVYAMPTAMSFSAASLAQARAQFNEPSGTTITSDESVDVRIEAYVRPDDAANKKVDFSVSWGTAPTHGSEPVDELAHPAHQKGREEMLSGGRQKAANLIGGIHPPCIQNARRDLMQAAFGGDGTHGFILFGRKDVFRYDLFHAAASLSD